MKQLLIIALILMVPTSLFACDDTLIMLLTAQNPNSEFAKSIRSFMSSLTELGVALKNNINPPFDKELNKVMTSWLEFSKRYMTNPPDEARNDMHWVEKTNKTARTVGEIRKFILNKDYEKAHDKVLELSVQIGDFFEAIGVSDEKQLFIKTSSELLTFQRLVLASDYNEAEKKFLDVEKAINEFKTILPKSKDAQNSFELVKEILTIINEMVKKRVEPKKIDLKINELQVIIEKLRSLILMQEWFPSITIDNGEKK